MLIYHWIDPCRSFLHQICNNILILLHNLPYNSKRDVKYLEFWPNIGESFVYKFDIFDQETQNQINYKNSFKIKIDWPVLFAVWLIILISFWNDVYIGFSFELKNGLENMTQSLLKTFQRTVYFIVRGKIKSLYEN